VKGFVLSPGAQMVFTLLRQAGFATYLVGGAVRDILMDRTVDDFDLATAALPEQVITAVRGLEVIPTGIKHGTVTVRALGESIEVTTMRCDTTYSDGRHPDSVDFTGDIVQDLARRDLTVNAMAWGPEGLCDPFDGQGDVRRQLLRCVGDAAVRFEEDGLRLLRVLRFAAQLGFAVEAKTDAALRAGFGRMECVAAERTRVELEKLLCGPKVVRVLRGYWPQIAQLVPELCPDYPDVLTAAFAQLRPIMAQRWAGLLIAGYCDHEAIAHLKLSNRELARIEHAIGAYFGVKGTTLSLKQSVRRHGNQAVEDALALQAAFGLDAPVELYRDIVQRHECCTLAQLAVTGNDLAALGLQGPAVGAMLEGLLERVMTGELPNQTQALLNAAKEMKA